MHIITRWALLLLFLPGFAHSQVKKGSFETYPDDPIGVKKTVLENGFTVYLVEDHNQPVIFGGVIVKAGGKYDPKDATGMGHYLEHMLFKGTQGLGTRDYAAEKVFLDKIDGLYEKLGATSDAAQRIAIQKEINENALEAADFAIPNELDRLLASIGSKGVNAFTQEEMIVYHNSFPPNQVEKWLDIYAHRFQDPVFRLFQSELEVVYEEKNRAMDDFSYALLMHFNKNLFKNHPYGQQSIIGKTEHLKNPSLIKMYEYFNTYYVANNMALVMNGDFDAEKVLPLIRKKFGALKPGEVPTYPAYPEEPFKGREYIKGRYTPVAAGIMGFRTVPNGHPEQPTLDVLNYLLSNDGETGLLDQLVLEQKVMIAQIVSLPYNDHGASLMIVVPKLIGQNVAKAEAIVKAEMQKLHRGEFEDAQLNAAKKNLKKDFTESLESIFMRGLLVADAFVQGRSWAEILKYPEEIDAVNRETVIEAAKKYYGENYLILESKMGFPKKEKLDKPGYKAPKPKKDVQSAYAESFEKLPENQPSANFVDFKKDMATAKLAPHADLYVVKNPLNDIFQLEIRFGIGNYSDPLYGLAAAYMNLLGTESMSTAEVKRAFNNAGCMYNFQATDNHVIVELSGFEEDLQDGLKMLGEILRNARADQDKVKIIVRNEKTNRKIEKRDVAAVGAALYEYVRYGNAAETVNRLPLKAMKKLEAPALIAKFREATDFGVEIHYSGRQSLEAVKKALRDNFFKGKYPAQPAKYIDREIRKFNAPTVYFLDRRDAIQSQLFFYKASKPFKIEDSWEVDAFNEYFGAGMSALVFQEIREFRSLAYTARATLLRPEVKGNPLYLSGYIGCQADKSLEALEVMTDLIQDMPEKPERLETIRRSVTQGAYMMRPGFRSMSTVIREWLRKGYPSDPHQLKLKGFEKLSWESMMDFYRDYVQNDSEPLVLVITGDSKRVNREALKKYGKLVEIKESKVLTQ